MKPKLILVLIGLTTLDSLGSDSFSFKCTNSEVGFQYNFEVNLKMRDIVFESTFIPSNGNLVEHNERLTWLDQKNDIVWASSTFTQNYFGKERYSFNSRIFDFKNNKLSQGFLGIIPTKTDSYLWSDRGIVMNCYKD